MKEAGKPVTSASIELQFALMHPRETAKLKLEEEGIEDNEERTAIVRYIPIGVGVGIVPWNYPVVLGLGKLDAAVLTGNSASSIGTRPNVNNGRYRATPDQLSFDTSFLTATMPL